MNHEINKLIALFFLIEVMSIFRNIAYYTKMLTPSKIFYDQKVNNVKVTTVHENLIQVSVSTIRTYIR